MISWELPLVLIRKYQGLVDALNERDFREKLCALKERWDSFEESHRSVPQGKLFQLELDSLYT